MQLCLPFQLSRKIPLSQLFYKTLYSLSKSSVRFHFTHGAFDSAQIWCAPSFKPLADAAVPGFKPPTSIAKLQPLPSGDTLKEGIFSCRKLRHDDTNSAFVPIWGQLHESILVVNSDQHKVREGVLPHLLDEILSTRIMVKQAMKKLAPSQQVLQRVQLHFSA